MKCKSQNSIGNTKYHDFHVEFWQCRGGGILFVCRATCLTIWHCSVQKTCHHWFFPLINMFSSARWTDSIVSRLLSDSWCVALTPTFFFCRFGFVLPGIFFAQSSKQLQRETWNKRLQSALKLQQWQSGVTGQSSINVFSTRWRNQLMNYTHMQNCRFTSIYEWTRFEPMSDCFWYELCNLIQIFIGKVDLAMQSPVNNLCSGNHQLALFEMIFAAQRR